MKKLILTMILCIVSVFPIITNAKDYNINSANLNVYFDENWYVFTRENILNNPDLEKLQATYEYMDNFFKENDAYIDAITDDFSTEFILRIKPQKEINNLSNYEDKEIKELAKNIIKEKKLDNYGLYNSNYKYIYFNYYDNTNGFYIINYFTIVNQKAYTYTIQKKEQFTVEEENKIKDIINSITYKIEDQYKEETKISSKDTSKPSPLSSAFNWKYVLRDAIIGGVLGGTIGGIIAYNKKKSKKKKSN